MKFKQLYPKSVRPSPTNSLANGVHKHRVRCSLCDSLLKASTTHRYLLMGKSAQENLDKDTTYEQCCERYLTESYDSEKLQMLCPKCCQNIQQVYSLHKNAEELTEKIRHTWHKTKRLNRTRHSRLNLPRLNENISSPPLPTTATDENPIIIIKEELDIEQLPSNIMKSKEPSLIAVSKSVLANTPYDLSNNSRPHSNNYAVKIPHQPIDDDKHEISNGFKGKSRVQKQTQSSSKTVNINPYKPRKSHLISPYPSCVPPQATTTDEHGLYQQRLYQSNLPYAHLMIDPPSTSSSSPNQQRTEIRRRSSSNSEQIPANMTYEPSIDGDQSLSPQTNDDASSINGSKGTRLSRRQYDFLIKLPDQQSLNTFIETSSAESGSRWTWRRTSANSRGYKVYYVCNFSMRRHYHPCPAAMYALFHPEGSISIYSCGDHQHIPKDRLPVSITDATKDEIFKCLQAGMATTDIREHLTRLQLPFGDTRKLNNFIKYHKELLRFGTVTNVRLGGTAYRQPQCWAIRRQPSVPPSLSTMVSINAEETTSAS